MLHAVDEILRLQPDVDLLQQIADTVLPAEPAQGADPVLLDRGHIPPELPDLFGKGPDHLVAHALGLVRIGIAPVYPLYHPTDAAADSSGRRFTGQTLVFLFERALKARVGDQGLALLQPFDDPPPQVETQFVG